MIIGRPLNGFTAWDETQHTRLSRSSIIVIGAVAALHLAGAAYLYSQHFSAPKVVDEPSAPVLIDTIRLKPDEPRPAPPIKPPPRVVPLHNAPPTPFTPPETLNAKPQTVQQLASTDPPVLPTQATPDVGALTPPAKPAPKVIRDPNWLARPSAEQLAAFYPPRALDQELDGQATLECLVTATGQLTRCTVSAETPRGSGFAEAALKAAKIFRMSPKTEDGQPVEGGQVHIPMRFSLAH